MRNTPLSLQSYLALDAPILALTSGRVYANIDLPPTYKPSDGSALLLSPRGGGVDHTSHMLTQSFAFRAYGLEPDNAWDVYEATHEAMQYKFDYSSGIRTADQEVAGVLLTAPQTGWLFVLSFYSIMFVN